MLIVYSTQGVPIRLTDERWQHITRRHPEMSSLRDWILETVAEPELIQRGDFGELLAVRFYVETPLTSKFLVAAYREISAEDGFIVTAYLTRQPSSRRIVLWKR
jgi:hypothetical protein